MRIPQRRQFEHSIEVGISFGLVSGVITTLGLIVGLAFGTESRVAVIGGIITIAVADSLSDALGIHISEESEGVHTPTEIWVSTVVTLLAKFSVSLTFLVPVSFLDLPMAVTVSIVGGVVAVGVLSGWIAHRTRQPAFRPIVEHVAVAAFVVAASAGLGHWVRTSVG